MIVDFEGLNALRGQVVMVDGGFDPLHAGHVQYFIEARKLGLPLLCSVTSDEYVATKHPVLLPQAERAKVIAELKPVDHVHVSDRSTAEVLEKLRPKMYVKGADWRGRLPPRESDICERDGIEVVFLDTVTDSSSARLTKLLGDQSSGNLSAFETFAHTQSGTSTADYDESYFLDQWRDNANDYSIETRRRIEGKNPELIRDAFQAKRVVDMGCGPGALLFLLRELGVEADGVDFAQSSKDTAPPEVRDSIHIGSVTDVPLPSDAYDLVICREVFEHLTVLQVQQAVQNICRITSRFVYLTTRFHPAPATLFDVTTEFEVDPTHINCMNKDFLRLMFVLQGMRRRLDLEQRMDWLNKRRVLVYEKASNARSSH